MISTVDNRHNYSLVTLQFQKMPATTARLNFANIKPTDLNGSDFHGNLIQIDQIDLTVLTGTESPSLLDLDVCNFCCQQKYENQIVHAVLFSGSPLSLRPCAFFPLPLHVLRHKQLRILQEHSNGQASRSTGQINHTFFS